MKLTPPPPSDVIRLYIVKQNHKTEYLTLYECTANEAKVYIQDLISKKVSLFPEGKRTTVNIREGKGSVNGKSISFHFYGLDPKTVSQLIIKSLENEPNTI